MAGMPEWLGKPEAMRAVDRYFSGENVENYRGALERLLAEPDLLQVAAKQRGVALRNADREIAHFARDWVGDDDEPPVYWRKVDPKLVQNKIRVTFIAALGRALDDHARGDALRPIRLVWTCADRPPVPGAGEVFEAGLTVDADAITVVFATSAPPDTPADGDSAVVAVDDGLKMRGIVGTVSGDPDKLPRIGTVLEIVEADGVVKAVDEKGATLWEVGKDGRLLRGPR